MTHASDASEKPRSARIDGSATPTIVTSKTIISSPRQPTTSARQRASCARAPPCAPGSRRLARQSRSSPPLPVTACALSRHHFAHCRMCVHPRCPDRLKPAGAWAWARAWVSGQPRATTVCGEPLAGCAASAAPTIGPLTACTVQPPALSLVLRAARCLLVVNDKHARAGGGRARELQFLLATGPGEQRCARAEHDGIDHEPQLVEETMPQQQAHQ